MDRAGAAQARAAEASRVMQRPCGVIAPRRAEAQSLFAKSGAYAVYLRPALDGLAAPSLFFGSHAHLEDRMKPSAGHDLDDLLDKT